MIELSQEVRGQHVDEHGTGREDRALTITLRHLEILRAVAGNRSLTLAAKQLGLSQPSLSQQLSKLEGDLGQRLVDRSAKGLHLTDAGAFLLGKAEKILCMVEDAEIGLGQFELGTRGQLTIGALTSLARSLLTPVSIELKRRFPEIQLNVVELSPATVVRQLQSRQVQMALISSTMLADQARHFTKVELTSDPYVLAVPKGMDGRNASVGRPVIMVDLGQAYQELVSGWYRRIIPDHQEVARCRTPRARTHHGRGRPRHGDRAHAFDPGERPRGVRRRPVRAAAGAAQGLGRPSFAISLHPTARPRSRHALQDRQAAHRKNASTRFDHQASITHRKAANARRRGLGAARGRRSLIAGTGRPVMCVVIRKWRSGSVVRRVDCGVRSCFTPSAATSRRKGGLGQRLFEICHNISYRTLS